MTTLRKPLWLKKRIFESERSREVLRLLREKALHTVCQGAKCPNLCECFDRGTAAFLIMGHACTRNCSFCAIPHCASPAPLDASEPGRLAEAVMALKLRHAVVTSVTRDDLPDGGAGHFADAIRAIRQLNPGTTVEILTPDFKGDFSVLTAFDHSQPDIFNHNLETVPRLYSIRPGASYARSLLLLQAFKKRFPGILTKSGLMVGLGETEEEIHGVLDDLRQHQCECITIGQYLNPSEHHTPVREFVTPERFACYGDYAKIIGFKQVFCEPFVRSSYRAEETIKYCY